MKILFTGYQTVYAVDINNNIFVWGLNDYGQVGNGYKFDVHTPTQISTSIIARTSKVICIGNPVDCSLILTDIGLYVSGANRYGERGDSSSTTYTTFQFVSNDQGFDFRNVIDIKSGMDTTYFLTKDRRVYASGLHDKGQRGTGIGDTDTRTTIPRLVTAFADKQGSIKEIGTNANALYIIDEHNILWGVGENIPSIPDGTPQYNAVKCSDIPVKILYSICFASVVHFIGMNGKVYYFGRMFSPYSLSGASFQSPSGTFFTWYRDFVNVDTLRDISNRAGVPVEGKVSNIFGTSAVTFYSS
jgi:alpha-tubulin suppressor-like RCC1 family protein